MRSVWLVSGILIFAAPTPGICEKPVMLVQDAKEGWHLEEGGQPFCIRGAGGYSHLAELKEAGANTVRIWHSGEPEWCPVSRFLDEAQAVGLKVMVGLSVKRFDQMDYRDAAAVAAQKAQLREDVRRLRDHPALLVWAVGNEVEWNVRQRDRLQPMWQALEDLVRMVHAEDPHHPVTVVLAGDADWKIRAVQEQVPSVDFLGINTYAGYGGLPAKLDRLGWEKPFLITEYGPVGWWAAPKTSWKAVREPTAAQKAAVYEELHTSGVLEDPRCLGSFAFIWGSKEEATFTFFGTHTPDGRPTPVVDLLSRSWTDRPPVPPVPRVAEVESAALTGSVEPGVEVTLTGRLEPAEAKAEWWLATDRSFRTKSGHVQENEPAELLRKWSTEVSNGDFRVTFQAPGTPDAYRLYGFFEDGSGWVETLSLPFRVRPPDYD